MADAFQTISIGPSQLFGFPVDLHQVADALEPVRTLLPNSSFGGRLNGCED
jgi:hypothetical protein